MSSTCPSQNCKSEPAGRFCVSRAALCLAVAVILGAAVARLAVAVQESWSPVVLFPLLVGGLLGLLFLALMQMAQVGHGPTRLAGLVLAVAVCVVGQHYASFLHFREHRQREEEGLWAKKPAGVSAEAFGEMIARPPLGFREYMRLQAEQGRRLTENTVLRGRAAWASWIAEGVLSLAAALAAMAVAARQTRPAAGKGAAPGDG